MACHTKDLYKLAQKTIPELRGKSIGDFALRHVETRDLVPCEGGIVKVEDLKVKEFVDVGLSRTSLDIILSNRMRNPPKPRTNTNDANFYKGLLEAVWTESKHNMNDLSKYVKKKDSDSPSFCKGVEAYSRIDFRGRDKLKSVASKEVNDEFKAAVGEILDKEKSTD